MNSTPNTTRVHSNGALELGSGRTAPLIEKCPNTVITTIVVNRTSAMSTRRATNRGTASASVLSRVDGAGTAYRSGGRVARSPHDPPGAAAAVGGGAWSTGAR